MAGNQYQPDPRQKLFLAYYFDPKSETFSNAYRSALKAGYSEDYATDILSVLPDWLQESQGEAKYLRMLKKAEKRLEELAESEDQKVSADISKFITGRLGKKTWSERTEITGEEGKAITIQIAPEIAEKNDLTQGPKQDSQGSTSV